MMKLQRRFQLHRFLQRRTRKKVISASGISLASLATSEASGVLYAGYSASGGTVKNVPPYVESVSVSGTLETGETLTISCVWDRNTAAGELGDSELVIVRCSTKQDESGTVISTLTNGSDAEVAGRVTTTFTYEAQDSDIDSYLVFKFTPKMTGVENTAGLQFVSDYTNVIISSYKTAIINFDHYYAPVGDNYNDIPEATWKGAAGVWDGDLEELYGRTNPGWGITGLESVPYEVNGYVAGGGPWFGDHNIPEDAVLDVMAARGVDSPNYLEFKLTGLDNAKTYDLYFFASADSFSTYAQDVRVTCVGSNTKSDSISSAYQNKTDVIECLACEPSGGEITITVDTVTSAGNRITNLLALKMIEK